MSICHFMFRMPGLSMILCFLSNWYYWAKRKKVCLTDLGSLKCCPKALCAPGTKRKGFRALGILCSSGLLEEPGRAIAHGVAKSRMWLSNWAHTLALGGLEFPSQWTSPIPWKQCTVYFSCLGRAYFSTERKFRTKVTSSFRPPLTAPP